MREHKHFGLLLDSKLLFTKHINDRITTARKGSGVIKQLAPYLPLQARDQIYRRYIESKELGLGDS